MDDGVGDGNGGVTKVAEVSSEGELGKVSSAAGVFRAGKSMSVCDVPTVGS